ncbi:hypothetical protein M3P21_22100 [Ruegeria sp. 2012CJ41-6]|uniref:Uncharacterized protein n=1 Tax=Ruegeria spongiae TaxID=2942209 RepID=A0ABT0QBC2_9RHOB|nr:hypothetical protein [Ruegeria spongiae]MCL6286189.1 hypothetical protein [Ruegeria spongiae]
MKICRVVFTPVDEEKTGDLNLTMDLCLDAEDKPIFKLPLSGYTGKPSAGQPDLQPFILYKDGTMDYGDDSEDPHENDDDRFEKADIFAEHRKIRANEYMNVVSEGENHLYKVSSINPYAVFKAN